MARIVLWHAPDVAGKRKAIKVPQHWPCGQRLCVAFAESLRGNTTIMELGTLMSCRVPTADVDKYGWGANAISNKRFAGRLRRRVKLFEEHEIRFSKARASQALEELCTQTHIHAEKPSANLRIP